MYVILFFRTWSQLYFSKYICRSLQKPAVRHLLLEARLPACTDFQDLPSGKHLEAIICRCQSASRCIWVGQQHFLPLEQLGGKENKCVLLSFVSYKTPLEHSHLEPIFLLFWSWLVFDGERNLPHSSFQVKRKFVFPWHQSPWLKMLLRKHSYICLKYSLFQKVSSLKGLPRTL